MVKVTNSSIQAPVINLASGETAVPFAKWQDGTNVIEGDALSLQGTTSLALQAGNSFSIQSNTVTVSTVRGVKLVVNNEVYCMADTRTGGVYAPKFKSDAANITECTTETLTATGAIFFGSDNRSLQVAITDLETGIAAVDNKKVYTAESVTATGAGAFGTLTVSGNSIYATNATVDCNKLTVKQATVSDSLYAPSLSTNILTVTGGITAPSASILGSVSAASATLNNASVMNTLVAETANLAHVHATSIKADADNGLDIYGLNSQYDYLRFKSTNTTLASKRDITIKHSGELDSAIALTEQNGISFITGETTIHNVVREITNIQSSIIELTGIDTSVVTSLGQQILNNTSNIAELTTEIAARTLYVDTELETINTNLNANTSDIFSLLSVPDNITISEASANPDPKTNEINAIGFGKNVLTADGVNKPVLAIEMTLQNSNAVPTYLAIYNYDRAWSGTGGGFRLLAVSKPVTWNTGDVVRWEFETPVEIPAQNFIQMYFLRTPTPPEDGADAHNLDFVYIKVNTVAGNNNDWGHRYARNWYFGREWDIKFIFTEAGRVYALEEQVEANTSAINWLANSGSADSAAKLVDGDSELILNAGVLSTSGITSLDFGSEFRNISASQLSVTVGPNTATTMTNEAIRIAYSDVAMHMRANHLQLATTAASVDLFGSKGDGYISLEAEHIHITTFGKYSTEINTYNGQLRTQLVYSDWLGRADAIWKNIRDNADIVPSVSALATGMQRLELRGFDLPPVLPYIGEPGNDYSVLVYHGCVTDLGTFAATSSPITILSIEMLSSDEQPDRVREAELWWETTNSSSYGDFVWPDNVKFISFIPELRSNEATRVSIRKEPNGTLICRPLYRYAK